MKLILYILALVSIGGALVLSKMNIDKHQEQLNLTKAELGKVRAKKGEVTAKEAQLTKERSLRDEAKTQHNKLDAEKDLRERDVREETKLSATFDDDLEELVGKKDEINRVRAEINAELKGEDIPLEGVEGFVINLEDEKKELNKQNVALQEEVSIFAEAVKDNKSVLSDFKDAQMKRRKNLAANKVSSLITAVDNEWGFVVIKPHAGSVIKEESKLVVIRGKRHIGRLTINAIEDGGGRVLANIDYSSLVSGMRIRPGDRVILSKPLTK